MAEDCNAAAQIRGDDLVELVSRAIEQLTIALATGEDMIEVATKKCSVLFGMLLGGVFESETFHHADAPFAKRFGGVDGQASYVCERPGGLDGPREIARVDRGYRVVLECFSGRGCLSPPAKGEGGCRVTTESSFSVSFGLTVTNEQDVRWLGH
jgi:hypothetical protein